MNDQYPTCAEVPLNTSALVIRVKGPDSIRFREMGLYEGAMVKRLMGNELSTVILTMGNSRICLNKLAASCILVQLL
jgi:Fe2+ transport system protein FeoA